MKRKHYTHRSCTKRAILAYFDKTWEVMTDCLEGCLKTGAQEDLHRFRVAVKKLQALLALSDYAAGQSKLKSYLKPVENVFKRAGVLRDAYISETLGQQPEYSSVATAELSSVAGKYRKRIKKARRTLRKKLRGIKTKPIRRFYQTRFSQIAAVLEALPATDGLHKARKQTKMLLYNYPLVQPSLDGSPDIAWLGQLQEAIGDWHDQSLAGKDRDQAVAALLRFRRKDQ
jgi:CHAD domain-containing protein